VIVILVCQVEKDQRKKEKDEIVVTYEMAQAGLDEYQIYHDQLALDSYSTVIEVYKAMRALEPVQC